MTSENKFIQLKDKLDIILNTGELTQDQELIKNVKLLVEELNSYRLEIELQNKELQDSHQKIAMERMKYKDLYVHAPIAYFTLDITGKIVEINQ